MKYTHREVDLGRDEREYLSVLALALPPTPFLGIVPFQRASLRLFRAVNRVALLPR